MTSGAEEVQRADDEFNAGQARFEEAAGREPPGVVDQAREAARAADIRRAEVADKHPDAWWDLQARQDRQRDAARASGAEAWLSRDEPEAGQ